MSTSRHPLLLLAPGLLSAVGCGSTAMATLSDVVEPDLVKVFPPEGRRWTYEAENEVIIALDRLDAARDAVLKTEEQIAIAEAAEETAKQRGGAGLEVAKARIDWLNARKELQETEVSMADVAVFCARTSMELTKARLVVRFDLPVEEGYEKDFEEQYTACAEKLEQMKAEVEKLTNASVQAKERWRQTRGEFVQRTGDHNHGLWID